MVPVFVLVFDFHSKIEDLGIQSKSSEFAFRVGQYFFFTQKLPKVDTVGLFSNYFSQWLDSVPEITLMKTKYRNQSLLVFHFSN